MKDNLPIMIIGIGAGFLAGVGIQYHRRKIKKLELEKIQLEKEYLDEESKILKLLCSQSLADMSKDAL